MIEPLNATLNCPKMELCSCFVRTSEQLQSQRFTRFINRLLHANPTSAKDCKNLREHIIETRQMMMDSPKALCPSPCSACRPSCLPVPNTKNFSKVLPAARRTALATLIQVHKRATKKSLRTPVLVNSIYNINQNHN